MPEIAMHILDLVQNSISAGATLITIDLIFDSKADRLTVIIADNGCGMSEEMLRRVESPFTTSRKTRKVGLGIPLFKQLATMCGGDLTLTSTVGQGTTLTAWFQASHVDLPPMGDMASTVELLLIACPDRPDFRLTAKHDEAQFEFNTDEVREAMGGLPLNMPDILAWAHAYVEEGMNACGWK